MNHNRPQSPIEELRETVEREDKTRLVLVDADEIILNRHIARRILEALEKQ